MSNTFIVDFWAKIFLYLRKISVFNLVLWIFPISNSRIEYIFVEAWALTHVFLSILSVPAVLYIKNDSVNFIIAFYALLRVFELVVYQINVLLFDEYRVTKAGKTYKLKGYRRMIILLIQNYFEVIFWWGIIGLGANSLIIGLYWNMMNKSNPFKFPIKNVVKYVLVTILASILSLILIDNYLIYEESIFKQQIFQALLEVVQRGGKNLEICVMKEGGIVERGSVEEVFNNPQHPYTKQLLDSIPAPKATLKSDGPNILEASQVEINYLIGKSFFTRKKNFFKAVKGVDINIFSGSTTGLVGESGSGKSSLAKGLLGLEQSKGSILFDGRDIGSLSKKERRLLKRDFQIVFQDPYGSLSPRMTVGDIVGEGLQVHESNLSAKEREIKILESLNQVELEERVINRFPHEFSGGQRQRIAIARAIILRPKLVLLDEPTSALDVSIQMQIIKLLTQLQDDLGLAYLCISHDLRVIRALSDLVYVMKDGEVVESGSSDQIFDAPTHPYTQELLQAAIA